MNMTAAGADVGGIPKPLGVLGPAFAGVTGKI